MPDPAVLPSAYGLYSAQVLQLEAGGSGLRLCVYLVTTSGCRAGTTTRLRLLFHERVDTPRPLAAA